MRAQRMGSDGHLSGDLRPLGPEDPARVWDGRLTREQRKADIEHERAQLIECMRLNPPRFSSTVRRDPLRSWMPILPDHVPRCRICTLPSVKGLCAGCKRLGKLYGQPLDSLEFLAIVEKTEQPERMMWDWKDLTTVVDGSNQRPPLGWLSDIAAGLSSYVEAHRDRLLADSPLLTWIPSRAPLFMSAMRLAAERGVFSRPLTSSGHKRSEWYQHGSTQAERISRTVADWNVDEAVVAGRPVLLFDDVFVTGASVFSYAAALRQAGATEVRGVVVGRHIQMTHCDYHDAARIERASRGLAWSPAPASVYRPSGDQQ